MRQYRLGMGWKEMALNWEGAGWRRSCKIAVRLNTIYIRVVVVVEVPARIDRTVLLLVDIYSIYNGTKMHSYLSPCRRHLPTTSIRLYLGLRIGFAHLTPPTSTIPSPPPNTHCTLHCTPWDRLIYDGFCTAFSQHCRQSGKSTSQP